MPDDQLLECLQAADLFEAVNRRALASLAGDAAWVHLEAGAVLFREDDPSDGLYVVVRGLLEVRVAQEDGSALTVGAIEPGGPVGEMQAVTGGRRTATVAAVRPSELVKIPAPALERLAGEAPEVVERLAEIVHRRLRTNQLTRLLPNLLGPVDQEVVDEIRTQGTWVHLQRGETLFEQGDDGQQLFLVISGRLAAIAEDERGERHLLGEIGSGEVLGEMALFTGEPRSASVYALRDSLLVRFSKPVFERFIEEHPHVLMMMTQMLIRRLRGTIGTHAGPGARENIAVVPVGAGVPLEAFMERLGRTLGQPGATTHLSSRRVDDRLGTPGIAQTERSEAAHLRLATWLDEQEDRCAFVLYEADPSPTAWTRRCIRRADHVLLVAWADADPTPGAVEALLEPQDPKLAPQRSLVLLHRTGGRPPQGTRRWLAPRQVHQHHHVRWDAPGDLRRVGRFLSGRAVGLVLSGGGARGFAHIGLVRALREHGVPIDMVGGTSIGAIIAAQAALEFDHDAMLEACRKTFVTPKPFKKYTLPLVSLLRHGVFDESAQRTYGRADLEDLWVKCFCIASNLSTAETEVIETGPVAEAILASSALPGVVTPRVRGGHLLVDGGVLNNIPSDVMRTFCRRVIVSDVGEGQTVDVDFETFPSPWQMLWQRLSPFHEEVRAPQIMSLLMRTATLSSLGRTVHARAEADLYLHPPVEAFGLLHMDRLDEIAEMGYRYAREVLQEREEDWLQALREREV